MESSRWHSAYWRLPDLRVRDDLECEQCLRLDALKIVAAMTIFGQHGKNPPLRIPSSTAA
jgi:hypothetical protein